MGLDQWRRGTVEMCPNPSPSLNPSPNPSPKPNLNPNPNPRRIGLSEYLLANSVFGMLHAVFGAQPLLVLRPTGPITAITIKLSDIADRLGLAVRRDIADRVDRQFQMRGDRGTDPAAFFGANLGRIESLCAEGMERFGYARSLGAGAA